jgi:hypothetical protein
VRAPLAKVALVALLFGCDREDVVAIVRADGAVSIDAPDGGSPGDASIEPFALCACQGAAIERRLEIVGGSFCSNAEVVASSSITVAGSFVIGGAAGLRTTREIRTGGELAIGGSVSSDARVQVDRDARIGGGVRAASLEIGGRLVVPEGETIDVSGAVTTSTVIREPVAVEPPCPCDDRGIAAYVTARRADNDDSAIGLDPESLANVVGPMRLELPSGRYYFRRISERAELTIVVTGTASLSIDSDFTSIVPLAIELAGGGALEIHVNGTLIFSRGVRFGARGSSSRLAILLAGSGTMHLDGGGSIAARIHGPATELGASTSIELFGTILIRRFAPQAELRITYDQ